MNFERVRRVHLIGVCGTAMASLAGLLKEKGCEVTGSDANVYPPMSTQLEALGIRLISGYRAGNIAEAAPDLVIPGNAIPRGNPELEEMLNRRLPYISMAEAVKEFFLRDKHPIVIAGTHGKTSTTSLAAWMLEACGLQPSFLVGGIPLNFERSFQWRPEGRHFVIEGDEYDTGFMDRRPKFVQYLPQTVILNPVEFDHADIYTDLAAVENAFWQMIKVVPGEGNIIVNRDNETALALARRGYSRVTTFGFHESSDHRITDFSWSDGIGEFRLNGKRLRVPGFGKYTLANAAAVAVCAAQLGVGQEQIEQGLLSFRGVKRRMELRGVAAGVHVYDDFAHHPTAIDVTLEGARLGFPGARIVAVFEPRSWSSRRNVFQQQFAGAFRNADVAVIAPVFEPEKVPEPIRLDPHRLAGDIAASGTPCRYIPTGDELVEHLAQNARAGDRLILMSNGSFDGMHERVLERLRRRA